MRSDIVKLGDARAPHRSLLRATGLGDDDFKKPFIAICNSHVDIIPGHVHLDKVGQFVKQCVREAGGTPFIFNTIGVDDGIAMGHEGMKFSLPSRELIADSVETMLRAHCLRRHDLHPQLRQDRARHVDGRHALQHPHDLRQRRADGGRQDARRQDGRPDRRLHRRRGQAGRQAQRRRTAGHGAGRLSHLRLLLGHVHGQQHELPVRGPGHGPAHQRHAAGHQRRAEEALPPRRPADRGNGVGSSKSRAKATACLPREIVTHDSIDNSMVLDMAMGGSTNTVLHILAIAREAGVEYDIERINELSRRTPNICKVAPSSQYHVEDVHNSGGVHTILGAIERGRPGLLKLDCPTVTGKTLGENIAAYDIRGQDGRAKRRWSWPRVTAGGSRSNEGMSVAAPCGVDPRSVAGRPGLRPGRLHPRGRKRLQPGGRAGDPLRQPRPEGRGRQGRRRPARNAQALRPGRDLRGRNRGLRRASSTARSRRATWW